MSSGMGVEKSERPRMKRVVVRRNRAFWEQTVAAWRGSGLRAEDFAAERGLSLYTLRKWATRVGRGRSRGEASGAGEQGQDTRASRFVEISLRGQAQGVRGEALTVEIEGGLRVLLSGRYAERLVGELLERMRARR